MKEGPRAVFFDFDGVILESADIKTWAFGRLFRAYPRELGRILDHHRRNAGISRYRKFDYIYRVLFRKPLPAAERRRLGREYARLVVDKVLACPMVPGARALLRKRSESLPLFVVSGAPQTELRRIVRERGLAPYFRGVYGSPRTKDELIRSLLRRHRLSPRETLFVGDAETDRLAAAKTGVPFVGRVPAGRRTPFSRKAVIVRDLRALDRLLPRAGK